MLAHVFLPGAEHASFVRIVAFDGERYFASEGKGSPDVALPWTRMTRAGWPSTPSAGATSAGATKSGS